MGIHIFFYNPSNLQDRRRVVICRIPSFFDILMMDGGLWSEGRNMGWWLGGAQFNRNITPLLHVKDLCLTKFSGPSAPFWGPFWVLQFGQKSTSHHVLCFTLTHLSRQSECSASFVPADPKPASQSAVAVSGTIPSTPGSSAMRAQPPQVFSQL